MAGFEVITEGKEANEAKAKSDSFQAAIVESNARAKSAEAQVASANAASRDAVAKVATAEARIKEAEARAAEAKLELEKFKAPRVISAAAQERMVKVLEVFSGTPFDLMVGTDSESIDLMRTIQSVLNKAGWKQVQAEGPIGLGDSNPLIGFTLVSGVFVEISAERLPDWLHPIDTLVGLLKSEHVDARGSAAKTGVKPNAVHISIGKKPFT
jgi:hypothetical protein